MRFARLEFETRDLTGSTPSLREPTVLETYALWEDFYPGYPLGEFREDNFGEAIEYCRILIGRDSDGKIQAFGIIAGEFVALGGRRLGLTEGDMLVSPKFSAASSLVMAWVGSELIRGGLHYARRRFEPIGISFVGQPYAYRALVELTPECYPRPGVVDDPQWRELYKLVTDRRAKMIPGRPFASEGPVLKITPAVRERALGSDDPSVRFFLRHVPDYGQGAELVVLQKFGIRSGLNIPLCLAKQSLRAFRRKRRRSSPGTRNSRT